jgi:adenine-specific DNA-methyltransferase
LKNAFEWRFEFPEVLNDEGDFVGFDVVIGNPPYGTLISEDLKEYIKVKFAVTQGPFEIYKFFIEQGLSLLRKATHLCFITPDTWTNLSYFKKTRLLIVSNELVSCTKTLYDVFDEATVDTNIFIIRKSDSFTSGFKIISETLEYQGEGVISDKENPLIVLKVKPDLIWKIERETSPLDEFIVVWRGMSAYGAANPEKPYNSLSKETEFHIPLLNGGDIGKYSIKWSNEYIKYGDWLHRPRPKYIYDRPHLLVQRIRNPKLKNRIVATLDEDKFVSSDGLSNMILKNDADDIDELKTILGIINSKLINYWFSFYFFDVNIKPEQLRLIPIKTLKDKRISEKVSEVLAFKKENPEEDTMGKEAEIDQFGLSAL